MIVVREGTVTVVQFGPAVDVGDGATLETGLATAMDNATTGIRISKNGAAMADRNASTVPAYDAMGFYRISINATDTSDPGTLLMCFEEVATCLPIWLRMMVMPANEFDSLFGTDVLQVDVAQWLGTAAATPTQAGVPEVDITFVGGVAQALPTITDVNTQVLDVLTVDTFGEPAQGTPGETVTLEYKLGMIYKSLINKKVATGTKTEIYNFAGSVVDHKRVETLVVDTSHTSANLVTGP